MTRARYAASITDFESELQSWETLPQSCVSGGPECAPDTKVTPSGFCEGTLPIPCLLGTKNVQRGSDPQQLLEWQRKMHSSSLAKFCLCQDSTQQATRLHMSQMASGVITVTQVPVRCRERTLDTL